jgi:DNA-binding CsgD family transcriptional regulator
VLDVVRTVGLARNRDEFFRSTLKGVVSLLPCLVATINEVDPLAGRVAYWVEPSSFHIADGAPELLAELAAEHPLIASFAKSGDGSAWRISDFWSQEEFHATRLYQELYQPMGVEYQMAVGLTTPLPTVLGLVVNRSDSDFSDGERAVLNAARPHLAQAWRNARDQERLRSLVDAANDAASESGWGVIVLWDPPEELTPGSLARLYRFFGQPTRTSPLPARVERWVASQIAQTSNPAELELARPLSARLDDRRLVLKYLPAQRAHPGAIVVSDERRTAQRRSYESLGLSTREAEIVRLVTAGESNSSIAGRLFVSPGTVKKHLDNVYNKLGVRGRGPLTAFLLDITSR